MHRRDLLALGGLAGFRLLAGYTGREREQHEEGDLLADGCGRVDRALRELDGEISVMVRLAGTDRESLADDPVDRLQTTAEREQEPLREYVSETEGVEIVRAYWITSAVLLTVDTDRVSLDAIAAIEGVERLHENFEGGGGESVPETVSSSGNGVFDRRTPPGEGGLPGVRPPGTQSEDGQSVTYGPEQIKADEAWATFGTRGQGATVGVLDSGVDSESHGDLSPTDGGWKDFVNDREEPYDDHGHGSHTSGIVVGEETADGRRYGVAPGADLVHGKILNENNRWIFSRLLDGIEWIVDQRSDVDVLVMSLFSDDDYFDALIDPIQNVRAAGVVPVGIAGNQGDGTSTAPGNLYEALSVGASDMDEDIWRDSGGEMVDTSEAWGESAPDAWPDRYLVPDVSAPGRRVLSASLGGGYERWTGTSMAAPHVGGTIALMQSASAEDLDFSTIKTVLQSTASAPAASTPDTRYGHGIVDALAAVREVTDTQSSLLLSADVVASPVLATEPVAVDVTLTNTGEESRTETVTMDVRNEQRAVEEVTVGPDQTAEVTLEWEPEPADAGEHPVTITVGDRTLSREVVVLAPASFGITAVETDGPVTAGEALSVDVTVENTGDEPDLQTVSMDVDGEQRDDEGLRLAAGETDTVTLGWETGPADAGEYSLTVASDDDTASREVVVLEPASFSIESVETDAPVTAGETLSVTATIANTGDESGTRTISLAGDGGRQVTRELTVPGNGTDTVTLAWGTEAGDAGEYSLTLTAEDDATTVDVRIEAAEDTEDDTADGDGAGFGVGGALAALGATGYALKRRLRADEQ